MLTSSRKSSSVSSFCIACFRFTYSAQSFFYFSPKCLFSVRLCQKIRLFALCTQRFSFHEFCNFLLFNFLRFILFLEDLFYTHDNYPHPRPTTHTHDPRPLPTTHDPRPTTHDPRHLATLVNQCSNTIHLIVPAIDVHHKKCGLGSLISAQVKKTS